MFNSGPRCNIAGDCLCVTTEQKHNAAFCLTMSEDDGGRVRGILTLVWDLLSVNT